MSEFTSDYPPQILASSHESDFAPYASGTYNAQLKAPKLLHDKHILHSICILRKMEVEEPWLGLWLPLHYRADKGVSQHMTLELG